ncbi:MAG: hypothetical protein IT365_22480 [Candidatus Hydrogenedentes bacterium]|nr:hypothetical protein [Candidatus Hydrogenedentota bacterium]
MRSLAISVIVRFMCFIFAGYPLVLSANGESPKEVDPDFDLLTMLADIQEANRAKIETYELTMRESSKIFGVKAGEIQQHTMQTFHWEVRKGSQSRISRKRDTSTRTMHSSSATSDELRVVVSDTYLAQWFVGTPVAYIYEYDSPGNWSEEVRRFVKAFNPRTPERYGFGNGSQTLRQLCEVLKSGSWQVSLAVEQEGKKSGRYRVTLFDDTEGFKVSEFWVESEKGGVISKSHEYAGSVVYREMEVQAKLTEGVWFPHRWTVRQYSLSGKDENVPVLTRESTNEVVSLAINPAVASTAFSWQAMDLPNNILVVRKDSHGRQRSMSVIEGELVPRELLDEH